MYDTNDRTLTAIIQHNSSGDQETYQATLMADDSGESITLVVGAFHALADWKAVFPIAVSRQSNTPQISVQNAGSQYSPCLREQV